MTFFALPGRIAFVLALVLSVSSVATSDALCQLAFFSLSATPEEAQALATSTYGKLLDLPKDSEARTKLYKHILNAADPFSVPEGENAIDGVRKPLAEFRKMLEKLGWETPELKGLMLETVRRKIAAQEKAKAVIETVSEENKPVLNIATENGQFVRMTSDARYYVTMGSGPNKQAEVHVYDSVTRKNEDFH